MMKLYTSDEFKVNFQVYETQPIFISAQSFIIYC